MMENIMVSILNTLSEESCVKNIRTQTTDGALYQSSVVIKLHTLFTLAINRCACMPVCVGRGGVQVQNMDMVAFCKAETPHISITLPRVKIAIIAH